MHDHAGFFPWAEFEAQCVSIIQQKFKNAPTRTAQQQDSLWPEIQTIEEFYIRFHASAFPGAASAKTCWDDLTRAHYAAETSS